MINWLLTGQRWLFAYVFLFVAIGAAGYAGGVREMPLDLSNWTIATGAIVLGINVLPVVIFSVLGFNRRAETSRLPDSPMRVRKTRFLVLVPAYNEERVIGNSVKSLMTQTYPEALYRVVVVFNGTDLTGDIARELGAEVFVTSAPGIGKTPALREFLDQTPAGPEGEYVLIFDADNVVMPQFLSAMDECVQSRGALAMQGCHKVLLASRNWISQGFEAAYCASTLMYNAGRGAALNSTLLCGTGFAIEGGCLRRLWAEVRTQTEDIELNGLLELHYGQGVSYVEDAVFLDEKPDNLRVAIRQRVRWMVGHLHTLRLYFTPLMLRAVKTNAIRPFELAWYYAYPLGLLASTLWLLVAVPMMLMGGANFHSLPLVVAGLFSAAAGAYVLGLPIIGFVLEHRDRGEAWLVPKAVLYSVYAAMLSFWIWPVAILLACFSLTREDWIFHTPHKVNRWGLR